MEEEVIACYVFENLYGYDCELYEDDQGCVKVRQMPRIKHSKTEPKKPEIEYRRLSRQEDQS
jgi:hypothetical protein